jgi:hypothetical protein
MATVTAVLLVWASALSCVIAKPPHILFIVAGQLK